MSPRTFEELDARARFLHSARIVAIAMGLSLLVLGTIAATPAGACSCASPDIPTLVASARSGDTALVLAQRTDLDGGTEGRVAVLAVIAGPDGVPPSLPGRFDDGGSCDPGLGGGLVGILVLERDGGNWGTTTCGMVWSRGDALREAGVGPAVDPAAEPARVVLAGDFGTARLAAIDDHGRVTRLGRAAPSSVQPMALASCPGGETLVELAQTRAGTTILQRWDAVTLEPVGAAKEIGGSDAWAGALACRATDGVDVDVALAGQGLPGEVVAASAVLDTLALITQDGELTIKTADATHAGDVIVGASFEQLAVAPDGQHVAAMGYVEAANGYAAVVWDATGTIVARRSMQDFQPLVGWLDEAHIAFGPPEGASPRAFGAAADHWEVTDVELVSAQSHPAVPGRGLATAGGSTLVLGDVPPRVVAEPPRTVVDPFLALAEDAVAVNLLIPPAEITGAGVDVASPAPTDPVLDEAPTLDVVSAPGSMTNAGPRAATRGPLHMGWWLVAAGMVLVAGVIVTVRARRARSHSTT